MFCRWFIVVGGAATAAELFYLVLFVHNQFVAFCLRSVTYCERKRSVHAKHMLEICIYTPFSHSIRNNVSRQYFALLLATQPECCQHFFSCLSRWFGCYIQSRTCAEKFTASNKLGGFRTENSVYRNAFRLWIWLNHSSPCWISHTTQNYFHSIDVVLWLAIELNFKNRCNVKRVSIRRRWPCFATRATFTIQLDKSFSRLLRGININI